MMLTEQEQKEIVEEFPKYEQKSAACVEALRVVQRHRGWVSDDAIRDIATFLEMSRDDVDGVATFYNLIFRRPVGRHVLFVCDSVSCWVMGCEKLKATLKDRLGVGLGETTADGAFTVLPIACLGACDQAPVMLADQETLARVDEAAIDSLLGKLEHKGEGTAA